MALDAFAEQFQRLETLVRVLQPVRLRLVEGEYAPNQHVEILGAAFRVPYELHLLRLRERIGPGEEFEVPKDAVQRREQLMARAHEEFPDDLLFPNEVGGADLDQAFHGLTLRRREAGEVPLLGQRVGHLEHLDHVERLLQDEPPVPRPERRDDLSHVRSE